jgi:hypothetical protein
LVLEADCIYVWWQKGVGYQYLFILKFSPLLPTVERGDIGDRYEKLSGLVNLTGLNIPILYVVIGRKMSPGNPFCEHSSVQLDTLLGIIVMVLKPSNE